MNTFRSDHRRGRDAEAEQNLSPLSGWYDPKVSE